MNYPEGIEPPLTVKQLMEQLQAEIDNGMSEDTPVVLAITKRDDDVTGLNGVVRTRAKTTERNDVPLTMWNKEVYDGEEGSVEVIKLTWF